MRLGKYGAYVGCSNYPECTHRAGSPRHRRQHRGKRHRRCAGPAEILRHPPRNPAKTSPAAKACRSWAAACVEKRLGAPQFTARTGATKARQNVKTASNWCTPDTGSLSSLMSAATAPTCSTTATHPAPTESVLEIGINRAVDIHESPRAAQGGRGVGRHFRHQIAGRTSGWQDHRAGCRYGPYIKYGKINATSPNPPTRKISRWKRPSTTPRPARPPRVGGPPPCQAQGQT